MFLVLCSTIDSLLCIFLHFLVFMAYELKRSFGRNGISITGDDEWWVGAIVRINVFQVPIC